MSEAGLEAIVSQLVTTLGTVTGIGTIYNYERFAVPPEDFPTVYEVSGKVDFATVDVESTEESYLTNYENEEKHRIIITVVQQVVDPTASRVAFRKLVERIVDTLRVDVTLNGTAEFFEAIGREHAVRRFADVALIHFARLTFIATERTSRV